MRSLEGEKLCTEGRALDWEPRGPGSGPSPHSPQHAVSPSFMSSCIKCRMGPLRYLTQGIADRGKEQESTFMIEKQLPFAVPGPVLGTAETRLSLTKIL